MGEEREHLVQFSKREIKKNPHINFFIFGHRHILDLPIAEMSQVVILGDWITYFSYFGIRRGASHPETLGE